MKYYNRDDYERNLESYEVEDYFTSGARNVFVYGFIVGAVIGSTVGLISISKSRQSDTSVPKANQKFKSNLVEQTENEKAAAERQVAQIKDTTTTHNELDAQKVAIQQETSDHNLADTSPQAQEEMSKQQSMNAAEQLSHINEQAEPTEREIEAQKDAVKEEAEDHNLSDASTISSSKETSRNSIISPNNLATVAKEKKKILNNNTQVSKNTSELIAEEGVKSNPNRIVPNLVTKKETKKDEDNHIKAAVAGTVTASGLAIAASQKRDAIAKNPKVAKNTADLLKPETLTSKVNNNVPNLVTKKIDNAVESSNKVENSADKAKQTTKNVKPQAAEQRVKQTHNSVSFKDGIIVHDEAEKGISNEAKIADNTSDSQTENETPTYSKNRLQSKKTEKAKSKIDKRTFND
ncbi:hypothetical protein AABC03_11775 [Staphylococcus nepalensis]